MQLPIDNLKKEYAGITEELSSNPARDRIKKLTRRHIELGRIIEKAAELERMEKELAENKSIAEQEEDGTELKKLAEDEIEKIKSALPKLEDELKKLLLPRDPADSGNAILEIRAGTGGDEAGLFAAELMRMYTRFSERHGFKVDTDSISRSELGGLKEAIIEVKGDGAYGKLRYEGGVHRVQRVPNTEKSGRVHTSTASVAVLPMVDEKAFNLDPKDVKMEATTSSGHGGQSVNTTYSAIRMVHLPTGITAQCQDERSQAQNREKAWRVLLARVAAHYTEERDKQLRQTRQSQIKGAERSDKIRTYNFPQDRITDHRLNENFHQIESRMDGDIEEIISQLKDLEEQEKLKELENS
ncbi:MAG: peptide chain release factor 1 [Candidatus Doudnabacteria bacterium RIFCSPHIGHO2_02_FULL_46_11]|uniref:Peptide chain release factor 1 n=1 Tax=Candidatus Doudnabacteria bacterium RIFCSPHIGHO2_02_FULL_46_11 TaxID=1817832 RepID=A0A1F5P899_9BACT|nr:MAG: peptide chain release factor 1 [Candidatus Doudnabacteria bacterium RIFCSPHIGHO2_02_FULL_46_11]